MFPLPSKPNMPGMNKGAQTRFENDQKIAATSSLASQVNPQQSGFNLKSKARVNVPGMEVGNFENQTPNANSYGNNVGKLLTGLQQQQQNPQPRINVPENYKPVMDQQDQLESFQRNIELQQFLESPQLDQAMTRAKLTQYFTSRGMVE